jgi:dipeptidyl aminopeptidase/acylaminoacyl peptidase
LDRRRARLSAEPSSLSLNVPFLESVRLIDALNMARIPVEFAMYPGEFHYFQRAHVLRDAWTRVERFFAQHLK